MMPEQRLRYPKQQQQQVCEQERLRQLRDHAHNQEAKLRRVRALRGQAEHMRLSNAKLVEEMEQMTGLFQQKQKELLEAVSRVDQLSRQLEALRSLPRLEPPPHRGPEPPHRGPGPPHRGPGPPHHGPGPRAQLEHLYKELQTPAEGHPPQQCGASRGAAEGPYIQAPSTASGPPGPSGQEQLVTPAYPDGTATLPMPDSSTKAPPRPLKPASGGEISEINGHAPPPIPARNSRSSEDLSRDAQASWGGQPKTPPPVPSKPRPPPPQPGGPAFSRPPYSAGTFPGKGRPAAAAPRPRPPPPPPLPARGHTLPLPPRQEAPPPSPPGAPAPLLLLPRPQTVAASSIYSVYTQRGAAPGKGRPPPGAHAPTRTQPRAYGKPVLPASGGQRCPLTDGVVYAQSEVDQGGVPGPAGEGPPPPPPPPPETERSAPPRPRRPLSPTKLLPFVSQPPYRRRRPPVAAGHAHLEALEALWRRLQRAPRPLKKKCGSVAEPEGPQSGPAHVQRLLYQKATLVAMETAETAAFWGGAEAGTPADDTAAPNPNPNPNPNPPPAESQEDLAQKPPPPPPLPPRSPVPAPCRGPPPQGEEQGPPRPAAPPAQPDARPDECPPPYPPPPYPSSRGRDLEEDAALSTQPPDVTGQVPLPPGKRSSLRRDGSERRHRGRRVQFSPLALLLDASLEGEYDLVQRVIYDVEDPSRPNDEGITALHNAVCAGHAHVVRFLLQFGVNVNAADSDGWTPLHCAASCNNAQVCEFLVESGAAPFAATYSDAQTAADKCEETEDGYARCSHFLHGVQEQMGVVNGGVVYALWDYEAEAEDELAFREGERLTVLRRRPHQDPHEDPHQDPHEDPQEDRQEEAGWWWARCAHREGYIPTNLLGLYLRIKPRQRSLA